MGFENTAIQKLVAISIIVVGTMITVLVVSKLLNHWAAQLARRTESRLDDDLLAALRLPILVGLILLGLWFIARQLEILVHLSHRLIETIFFLVYWMLGYLIVFRLIVRLAHWYQTEIAPRTETRLDEQIAPFVRRILLIVVSIIAIIVLLGFFNVNNSTIGAFITTLGVGSLALALAAQTALGDMFSGIMIMVDRPYRIGDRIELVDLNTWGDVMDIGLRSTRILTRDNRMVVIPNSVIGQSPVINHSIPDTVYRVQTEVSVAYGVDIDQAREVLIQAVKSQPWVMVDKPVEALFLEFQDSGLLFRVRCWIEHFVDTRPIIDKLNTCLYKALNEARIEILFPQRVVHLRNQDEAIN